MPRWIVFDDRSAKALACRLPERVTVEHRGGTTADALELALESGPPSMVLLPGSREGEVLVMHAVRYDPPVPPPPAHDLHAPIGYQAGGFLGLHDEPVYEEDPRPRPWWRRIWD